MGLRDKLRRLEHAAQGEITTLMCQCCGEELRVAAETDLELIAHEWVQTTGATSYQPTPPDVFKVVEHPCGAEALVEKRSGKPWPLMDIGGGRYGLTR